MVLHDEPGQIDSLSKRFQTDVCRVEISGVAQRGDRVSLRCATDLIMLCCLPFIPLLSVGNDKEIAKRMVSPLFEQDRLVIPLDQRRWPH